MPSITKKTPHLGLSPWCNACEDDILQGESTILFLGHEKVMFRALTRPFDLPPLGPATTKVNGFLLCQNLRCRTCDTSPECAAVHYQCFKTFVKYCELPIYQALDYLWTIAFFRRPWAKTPRLYLKPQRRVNYGELRRIAYNTDLAGLQSMPLELLDMIRQFSPHTYLWRLITVLDLSRRATTSAQPLSTLALQSIESWKRGEQPAIVLNKSRTAVRIIIDSDGIRKIECLSAQPGFVQESSSHQAYIVEEAARLSGVKVHIKDGLLRLHLPSSTISLPIWDTPCPPKLADCYFQPKLRQHWQRFRTANLEETRGMTFFYSMGRICGIYAHSLTETCALSIFERFSKTLQPYLVWIYLPIARKDRIIELGTRKVTNDGLCIRVCTELSGVSVLGPHYQSATDDRWFCSSKPVSLAFNEPSDNQRSPVSLGAYNPSCSATEEPRQLEPLHYEQQHIGHFTYFSSAPLNEIYCAYVFEDEGNGLCRGILFEYISGGSQAVGQCRLGVDLRRKYILPSAICFRTSSWKDCRGRHLYGVQVDLGVCSASSHPSQETWQCRVLSDARTLHFWFTEERSVLCII
ncbi:hypothetical protein VM1G_10402 [Cytospora mali]|uniref:Uncharacterized protein n=1 Tax=Cytospora mali TaxID=578113 RepID=A0A194VHW3_CYTMA|nr:hypothetical protein VM1G_10402 [Valsa mali]